MKVFQEEIFGPVTGVTTFRTEEEAIEIANDTIYGLGAGVWTRDAHQAYTVPRAIQAGRVWVNCYHAYPAHAPFGGYKKSGFGRETHKMMLNQCAPVAAPPHEENVPPRHVAAAPAMRRRTHAERFSSRCRSYRQTKNMLVSMDKNKLGFF